MPLYLNHDTRHGLPGEHSLHPDTCIDARNARSRVRLRPCVAQVLRALGLIVAASAIGPTFASAAALVAGDTQAVVELRQYTLHPGQRDTLIDLFEQHFIEAQEQAGLRVIGQFRDLDHPDRFVWLRSFDSMPARKSALETFYGGPVWKAHREAANATMIDSDNVLLLRPAQADARSRWIGMRGPHSMPTPRMRASWSRRSTICASRRRRHCCACCARASNRNCATPARGRSRVSSPRPRRTRFPRCPCDSANRYS